MGTIRLVGFNKRNVAVNDNIRKEDKERKLSLRLCVGLIMVATVTLWGVVACTVSMVGQSLPSFSLPGF